MTEKDLDQKIATVKELHEASRDTLRLCEPFSGVAPGNRIGKLTVLGVPFRIRTPRKRRGKLSLSSSAVAVVLCRCGNIVVRSVRNLRTSATNSCGCLQAEATSEANSTHRDSWKRLWIIWTGMKHRCSCPTNSAYRNYGGRGITVCQEWQEYENFRAWAMANGYSHELSLDRIDNDGPYAPSNCRWATKRAQANNTRVNVMLTAFGETKSATEWTRDKRCRVCYTTLKKRIASGWDHERAIAVKRAERSC